MERKGGGRKTLLACELLAALHPYWARTPGCAGRHFPLLCSRPHSSTRTSETTVSLPFKSLATGVFYGWLLYVYCLRPAALTHPLISLTTVPPISQSPPAAKVTADSSSTSTRCTQVWAQYRSSQVVHNSLVVQYLASVLVALAATGLMHARQRSWTTQAPPNIPDVSSIVSLHATPWYLGIVDSLTDEQYAVHNKTCPPLV